MARLRKEDTRKKDKIPKANRASQPVSYYFRKVKL
jgi:hypothetical protein